VSPSASLKKAFPNEFLEDFCSCPAADYQQNRKKTEIVSAVSGLWDLQSKLFSPRAPGMLYKHAVGSIIKLHNIIIIKALRA